MLQVWAAFEELSQPEGRSQPNLIACTANDSDCTMQNSTHQRAGCGELIKGLHTTEFVLRQRRMCVSCVLLCKERATSMAPTSANAVTGVRASRV